ncbi:MAG TPA: hypothetical protein VF768_04585 [Holophagaceae bacterium]
MRRAALLTMLPLLLGSGRALQAQSPNVGFSLNLLFPTGDFNSKSYPPYYSPSAGAVIPTQTESYDLGLGGSFFLSFPVDRTLALRLSFSGAANNGTNTAPGTSTINLRHSEFNLGGEMEIFPNGTAYRHRGLYFLGGLSADFEQFDRSFGDPLYDYTDTTRKSRLGGTVGIGHTFGWDAGVRFNLELAFHKTLTGNNANAGDPPNTDYLRLGFGWIF